jgi:hypothetical protein
MGHYLSIEGLFFQTVPAPEIFLAGQGSSRREKKLLTMTFQMSYSMDDP